MKKEQGGGAICPSKLTFIIFLSRAKLRGVKLARK